MTYLLINVMLFITINNLQKKINLIILSIKLLNNLIFILIKGCKI